MSGKIRLLERLIQPTWSKEQSKWIFNIGVSSRCKKITNSRTNWSQNYKLIGSKFMGANSLSQGELNFRGLLIHKDTIYHWISTSNSNQWGIIHATTVQ